MNRLLCAIALFAVLLPTVPASIAHAQDPLDDERPPPAGGGGGDGYAWEAEETVGPTQPSRIVLTVGGGSGIRLVINEDSEFDQQLAAPGFIDVMGAFVLPGARRWRHGLGLTISTNVTSDGSDVSGVNPFVQWVFAPTYLGYWRFGEDWLVTAHAGVPLGVSSDGDEGQNLLGLDVGGSAAFYITAGFGVYVEASLVTWLGSFQTIHPILNYEGGIVIDYEVLP